MIKSKRVLAAALVAALGLTAAACGDDDEEATPETEAPGDTSAATTPEGTEAPADGTDAPPAPRPLTGRGDTRRRRHGRPPVRHHRPW